MVPTRKLGTDYTLASGPVVLLGQVGSPSPMGAEGRGDGGQPVLELNSSPMTCAVTSMDCLFTRHNLQGVRVVTRPFEKYNNIWFDQGHHCFTRFRGYGQIGYKDLSL